MYKIEVPAYIEYNGNLKANLYDIANNSTSILMIYSYSISNKLKSSMRCRGVKDFNSLDFSMIKEKTILLHDLSKIKDVDELRQFIEKCESNGKYLILPSPKTWYKPYGYNRKSEDHIYKIDNLYNLYSYIDGLKLEDIGRKEIFRDYRLKQLIG
jgi:hypothetical protein